MRQLLTVLKKEVLDGVRDRRVWLVVLVAALAPTAIKPARSGVYGITWRMAVMRS